MEKNIEPLFRKLFDKTREISGIGVWHVDLINQTVFWDENTKKIHEVDMNFKPNLEGGINFYKEGFSRDEIARLCNNIIENGEPFETELEIVSAKGTEIWVKSIGMPQFGGADEVVGFYGTFQEITADKKKFDEVSRLKERAVIAAAAGNVGIWDWDVVKNELVWDDQMYALYGVKSGDFSSAYEAWQNGLHHEDKEEGDKLIQEALQGNKEFDTQFRVLRPNGEIRFVQAKATVFRDENGLPLRMLGTNWDVTEEVKRNQELEELTTKLALSNEQLEEFAYVASHDLKAPIRNMGHYATFLEEDFGDEIGDEGKEMLKGIKDQAKRMTDLVDDLLSFSRVKKIKLEQNPAPITSLVREVAEFLEINRREDIEFKLEDLGELKVDIVKMREVFNNLITNAIKYNDSDVKSIKIWRVGNKVFVKDNGIGIDLKFKEKVFSFFKRLHAKDEYGGGTGAGMAIVQKVLERHKATIDFESKIGEGTTFIIDFESCAV